MSQAGYRSKSIRQLREILDRAEAYAELMRQKAQEDRDDGLEVQAVKHDALAKGWETKLRRARAELEERGEPC